MATKDPREPFTRINVQEAEEILGRDGAAVIDVREPNEYNAGHVPGAKLIPVATVYARREELPKDKELVFVCAVGQRSALACEMAAAAGFTRLYNLEGGTEAWIKAGLPVEK
ncbi:MAG TPA: rhodanese-like domain-containing protein [Dehalococcoidia bacterium]|nr:rhodanese-like domain-containing protein [Dehalococcoidia bacterium]